VNPRVGYATVYRTLRLLRNAALRSSDTSTTVKRVTRPRRARSTRTTISSASAARGSFEFSSYEIDALDERIAKSSGR